MILLSKLQPLTPSDRTVTRPRLGDQPADTRVTLVTAPAGFGKTTLVAQWLAGQQARTGWLSLDTQDNQFERFVLYFVSALQRVEPGIGQDTLNALQQDTLLTPQQLATLLVNSIVGLDDTIILVLDDYHVIDAQAVHDFLIFLVENTQHGLQLIITTRHDPPFPARWRVRGWLRDLRVDDLRFSPGEAAAYLNGQMLLDLPADMLDVLVQRTEGWIAGLHLAGLALRAAPDKRQFVQQFGGSQRFVIDYLLEEVLEHQPEHIQQFLLHTAVLERMNAPLCDAVTGRGDSASILDELRAANLFLVPLGEGWCRYHHLFADVLRLSLAAAAQRDLHRRAAGWFAAQNLTEEAVYHYLQADEPQGAAAAVADLVLPAIGSGDHLRLKSLLTMLPEGSSTHPKLLLARSWFATHAHRLDQAVALLDTIALNEVDDEVCAWVETIRALIAYSARQIPAVLPHIEAARRCSMTEDLTGMYDWLTGVAQWEIGQSQQAIDSIRAALRAPSVYRDPFGYSGISYFLSDYLNQTGRWQEALAVCERLLAELIDPDDNLLAHTAPVVAQIGILHYEANNLDLAEYHLKTNLHLSEPLALTQGLVIGRVYLALIAYARGDTAAAYRTLHDARHVATSAGALPFALVVDAVELWLNLRDGNLQPMQGWLEQVPFDYPHLPFTVRLIALRGLIYNDDPRTLSLFDALTAEAQQRGHVRRLIPLHILRALHHDQHAEHNAAFDRLRDAVTLAAPNGYQRDFLDEAPRLLDMLTRIRDAAPAFIDSLVQRAPQSIPLDQPLVEPLTERELDVLRLANEGLSNREIAAQLFVAVSTVKSHIKHAFSKLDADSRTRAIARARELGLI